MKERLFFEMSDGKREVLEALKNENKYTKKIPIVNEYGETIAKTTKFDVYSTYIDFWLDDAIADYVTETPGRIKQITLKKEENSKGTKVLRIKSIIA